MSSACRAIILGVLGWLICSCFSSYTGIYFLERSQEVTWTQTEEIVRSLRNTLATYGIYEDDRRTDSKGSTAVVFFSRRQPASSLNVRKLTGSNAHISIAIGVDRRHITIRDFSNLVETDFMRALKGSIERELEKNGIPGARFERQMELFNS